MLSIEQIERLQDLFTGYEDLAPKVRRVLDMASRQKGLSLEAKLNMALWQVVNESQSIQNPPRALAKAIPTIEADLGVDLCDPRTFRSIRRTVFDNLDEYERFQKALAETD